MPRGWGTGGIQVTAAVLGRDDVLKVIDQGADDTTNAVSIRKFFERTAGIATTTATEQATVIQTRHRIPEAPLQAHQIIVFQVPIPEPLRFLEPRETETRAMHALEEYGVIVIPKHFHRALRLFLFYERPDEVQERDARLPDYLVLAHGRVSEHREHVIERVRYRIEGIDQRSVQVKGDRVKIPIHRTFIL